MATGTFAPGARSSSGREGVRPGTGTWEVVLALAAALAFVVLTRWPVMRTEPFDSDEFGFLDTIRRSWFPMFHTLFLASARALGPIVGDSFRGFVVLDMVVSALALLSTWWWLRAVSRPSVAVAATLALGCGPVFWAYGAMAANYTAIVLVGSFLLGVAVRTWSEPRPWHPYAAAAVLAWGTGYRQDIGSFWLPVLFVIFWRHRWSAALRAGALFTVLNLAWIGLMLHDAGGWHRYRAETSHYGYTNGYLNSVWHLGIVDAPLRYAVKGMSALLWTLGPGLAFAPRGLLRLRRRGGGPALAGLLVLSILPALGAHLLFQFGSPGYAFHYVPALIALIALGIGRAVPAEDAEAAGAAATDLAPPRLAALAMVLASVFWFYPTNYDCPGLRGSFDLAFGRQTRIGLRTPVPQRTPAYWRTANSVVMPDQPPSPVRVEAGGGMRGN